MRTEKEEAWRRVLLVERENTGAPRLRFQLGDHLDTVALEVDETGAEITYEEHMPYGETALFLAFRDVPRKRYRYTGKERDEESGLQYHSARYLAPWLGRWCSADPAEFVDGPNLFRYVEGSPTGSQDPTGTQRSSEEDAPPWARSQSHLGRRSIRRHEVGGGPRSVWVPVSAPEIRGLDGNTAADGAEWALSGTIRRRRDGTHVLSEVALHIGLRGHDGTLRWERFDRRRWDLGASASSDDVGNFVIETVGSFGLSLAWRLGSQLVSGIVVRVLDAAGERIIGSLFDGVLETAGTRLAREFGATAARASGGGSARHEHRCPQPH